MAGAFAVGFLLVACQPQSAPEPAAPQVSAAHLGAEADDLIIVDCLLPGRVRQLGTRMTYLEPRRPTRTDRHDCAIRGGEYVAFDRADYTTALAIWMQQANEGDPEAMTYVGEIHERGLGRPADPVQAASWYRRAAELDHRRAQINLANLYAEGRGVTRDPERAVALYAQASGIPRGEVVLAAAEPAPPPRPPAPTPARREEDVRQIETLRAELEQARRERERLAARLTEQADVPSEVTRERERLEAERAELARLRGEIEARRRDLDERERALDTRVAGLGEQREALAAARATLEAQKTERAADAPPAEELVRREAELEAQAAEIARLQADLDAERTALAEERGRRLADLDAELEARRTAFERELAEQRAQFAEQAGASDAERAAREQRMAELQSQVAALEQRLAAQTRTENGADAPVIRLLDPELPERTRGPVVIKVRGGLRTRSIAGRVESAAGLLSFTVNDRSIEPDGGGAFRTEVALAPAGGTTVQLVAVDRRGRRTERSFVLETGDAPEERVASAASASASEPALQVARAVDFGRYHALVIGNNNYRHIERLDMAIRDAEAIADILRSRYGFQVTLLRDATKRDIFQAFRTLRETLTEKDNLLIYYAGHGIFEDVHDLQRGYWLPIDADHHDDFQWIPTDEVVAQVDAMSAKQVLIVADSCFSGAFMKTRSALARLRTGRSLEAQIEWYRARAGLRTRAVLTSGGLEPVLDAGGGGHSVFARALLDVLEENDGILEGAELYRNVATRVRYAAAAVSFAGRPFEQTPRYARLRFSGDGELADFFFVPANN